LILVGVQHAVGVGNSPQHLNEFGFFPPVSSSG
jgi:hypothetical protein